MIDSARSIKGVTLGNGRWLACMDTVLQEDLKHVLLDCYPREYRWFGVKQMRYDDGGVMDFDPPILL